ncbi:triple tyrosine motif-containing protein [Oceanihabitans sp. 2_MG-2023]|uniref:helix-turn-helix and ligand-binding sensor domain-containing protein n=1 Tax=Oceanihabitans sp. 2_MG-2023 TaxID=3062661 RepID=UPI0026E2B9D1|nr:triple tyrosine motif-containing protein [Oceanihabitans sp. 2_MG-2023]MDO6596541.1 triple tyrosine motif-containing protein [Oceanihabitans sp. 2_MG-2023]
MQKNKIIIFLLFGLMCGLVIAQEIPPIETYSPKDFGAENQNWSISQSKDKHIYIANNKGLLEFNGASWTLYPSPNETIFRTVHVVDNLIYTGCYMEFGFWKRNEQGTLTYTSLSNELEVPVIEDEHFWNIISLDNWILFQSLNRIIIYDVTNASYKVIDSKTTLTKIFKVNETIYFQKLQDGIYKIENGSPKLVTNQEIVKNNIVVNIFNNKDELLIQTQEKGLYQFTNNKLIKWDNPINNFLANKSVYSSIKLKDDSFAFGTISNGILLIDQKGNIKQQINHEKGLSNNTILSLFQDQDSNIWLGLDNGINCINITSPFSIFDDIKGELGTIYTSALKNNYIYLGTNQGLFYRNQNSKEPYKFIEGTKGQVWSLVNINNILFCGHDSGTFIVNNNQVEKIANIQGTWNIKTIDSHENLLLQGNYNGLNILEKKNNKWQFRNKIEGFNSSSKYFERINTNEIFVNHEYKGVFKIIINEDFTKAIQVTKDTTIKKGLRSSLIKYNDNLFYSYKNGVFKYNTATKTFKIDTVYSKLLDSSQYISGKLITDTKSTKLWGFTNNSINYISPGKLSNEPNISKISLPNSIKKGMSGYENILHLENEKYLFGTSTGYIIIDLDKLKEKQYTIHINTITKQEINKPAIRVKIDENTSFNNNENNIEFSYNVTEFEKFHETQYQYQLLGLYNTWSNWSSNSSISFNNLPFGDYTFNVRAKIANSKSNNIATYNFNIAKPWYLSNLMIALYILGLLVFSFMMHTIYKRYYRKQREKLLQNTQRELDLKKLENEQQLMSFKNEKLQQDVNSKNRELAISTMSLIKKNEFLNNIKNELKNADENKNLKSVIKIIDNNLNNTNDWKLFQEAFNNADKDFLKKIKAIHPSLTPNDLRLCAYLRLNLSSKEIAPLLNISPRSVEVKRYRLRKKIELPHEASLTSYILDL